MDYLSVQIILVQPIAMEQGRPTNFPENCMLHTSPDGKNLRGQVCLEGLNIYIANRK
jgi:hypothetical protein